MASRLRLKITFSFFLEPALFGKMYQSNRVHKRDIYIYRYNFLLLTWYVITEQGNWEIQGLDIHMKILQLDKKLAYDLYTDVTNKGYNSPVFD